MNYINIFLDIKKSFDGLWLTKERGNSLEIITPYATTNNKFVSVFLKKQNDEFIISDGGWLNNGVYGNYLNEESCFLKILFHYQNSFDIKNVESKDDQIFYYLKTDNPIDIPSKVFDLSSFIQSVTSISEINFESIAEKEIKKRFISKANSYLKSIPNSSKIRFNKYLDPSKKELKFNAIYNKSKSEVSLINYITGSTINYFSNSISRTNMIFEMAEESIYKDHIQKKISLIDNNASGFLQNKLAHYILHLKNQTGSEIVNWSEKEKLEKILE